MLPLRGAPSQTSCPSCFLCEPQSLAALSRLKAPAAWTCLSSFLWRQRGRQGL